MLGSLNGERGAIPFATFRRNRDRARSVEILSRHAIGIRADFLNAAARDDLPAAHAGPGTEVDHQIRRSHRILVMFDDDDRVTQVTQVLERVEKARIVPLM